MTKKNNTLDAMRQIFKRYPGSITWAASRLDVSKVTISRLLSGQIKAREVGERLVPLFEELKRTKGKCMGRDVDGPSVRHRVNRIRGRRAK